MTIFRHFSEFVPLPPPHFEDNWILKFSTAFLFIKLGLAKIQNFGLFWFILRRVGLEKPLGGRSFHPTPLQEGLKGCMLDERKQNW